MEILNAQHAREFAHAWLTEASPTAAARHLGFAIEGQQRCAGICRTYRRTADAAGHDAAIEVLRAALAEAHRLERERDESRAWATWWATWLAGWEALGAAVRRGARR